MKFTVILSPEAGGGYSVVCPAVPGCVSQGDSLEEALATTPTPAASPWNVCYTGAGRPAL